MPEQLLPASMALQLLDNTLICHLMDCQLADYRTHILVN